jgi:hypothetical protein
MYVATLLYSNFEIQSLNEAGGFQMKKKLQRYVFKTEENDLNTN